METQSDTSAKLAYSIAEAEVKSGLSRASIYRAIDRGDLRRIKVGSRTLIPAADLEGLCAGRDRIDQLVKALAARTHNAD